MGDIFKNLNDFNYSGLMENLKSLKGHPINIIVFIIDICIVMFLAYSVFKLAKNTRVLGLLKGLLILVLVTIISNIAHLYVLNFILSSFLTYGFLLLIVIFQPELRRALEGLGKNRFHNLFGVNKTEISKTKENLYKLAVATMELSKNKIGALIVIEKDIKINDIIESGIEINGDISPQLIVNIFIPNTPLHDGACIISENKIKAAACMLPLASDLDIAKELGTRHRAAIGISKESDAIVIVVSEETGKISIAKSGTLIADLKEETLKKILVKNIIKDLLEDKGKQKKGAK
jgi:diadenylate cyclase